MLQRSAACFFALFFTMVLIIGSGTSLALAAEIKIGVINMQQILSESEAGKKAEESLAGKMDELRAKFKKDEDKLIALQQEIEKKSSAWSDEMKQEKGIEFQKMRRDLQVEQEDANLELKKFREEKVGPILKELQAVVKKYAGKNGYTIILPHNVVLYSGTGVEITDNIIKELNSAMK
jgi:outer membrane protein